MDKPLAEQLRSARLAADLKQVELAERLGYSSHSEVSRIERGEQAPGNGVVDAWVRACRHRIAVVPEQSTGLDAFAAALADLTEDQRTLLRRVAEVLPHLPPPLAKGLQHDVELWESYVPEAARSRA